MNKELDHIASVTSVGDLPQKMEKAENAKVEVEAKILERVCVFYLLHYSHLFITNIPECSTTRNDRGVGTVRKENERRSSVDRKD